MVHKIWILDHNKMVYYFFLILSNSWSANDHLAYARDQTHLFAIQMATKKRKELEIRGDLKG